VSRATRILLPLLLATILRASSDVPVGRPAYGPAPGEHWFPRLATDGSGFLVVWSDGRDGDSSVRAARLSPTGDVLDRTGLFVAAGFPAFVEPVWTGSLYVVVSSVGGQHDATIFAVTIDRDGNVGPSRVIAEHAVLTGPYHTASDGRTTMIAYARLGEVRVAILDREANRIADVRLVEPNSERRDIAVTTNGTDFFIAWSYVGRIQLLRVSRDGRVIGIPRDLGSGVSPALSSDGRDVLVLYREIEGLDDYWVTRRATGDLSEVLPRTRLQHQRFTWTPSLVWDGTGYEVHAAASEEGDSPSRWSLVYLPISRDGTPAAEWLTAEDIQSARGKYGEPIANPLPRAVSAGGKTLVAWIESNYTSIGLTARIVARIYAAGSTNGLKPKALLTWSANAQRTASVAFGGSNALVVWNEPDGLFASRVSADGRTLDGRGMQLGESAPLHGVVFDGTQYVVAWGDAGGLQIRFITQSGQILRKRLRVRDMYTFAVGTGRGAAAVAWTDYGDRLRAARIDPQSLELDTPVLISTARAYAPRLASNGSETLVLWHRLDDRSIPIAVEGARLSRSMTLLDAEPLVIGDLPGSAESNAVLASDGEGWLVSWYSSKSVSLRVNRVLRNGSVPSGPEGIHVARGWQPALAFDGEAFGLVWREERTLHMTTITASDPLVIPGPTLVATIPSSTPGISYAIAPHDGSFGLAYSRVSDATEHGGVPRIFLRLSAP
jgi:hypothetical protein